MVNRANETRANGNRANGNRQIFFFSPDIVKMNLVSLLLTLGLTGAK